MFTKKRFIIIIVIILFLGISGVGLETPAYDDTYEKVWDSGNILPNPAYKAAICDLDKDGKREIITMDHQPLSGKIKAYVLFKNGTKVPLKPLFFYITISTR